MYQQQSLESRRLRHLYPREFKSWMSARNRCSNRDSDDFANYGQRGVTVCERWMQFEYFMADMGPRPLGCSLDRYPDGDGNYEPGNCRWATRVEQNRNKRNNIRLTWQGETLVLSEWADRIGISFTTLHHRLAAGWNTEQILTTPTPRQRRDRQKRIDDKYRELRRAELAAVRPEFIDQFWPWKNPQE